MLSSCLMSCVYPVLGPLSASQCVQLVATARRALRSASLDARLRASSCARLPCGCGAAAAAAPRAAAAAAGRGGRSSMRRYVAEARGSKGRGRGRYCENLRESRLQRCGCRRRFRRTCSKVEPGSAAGCRLGGELGTAAQLEPPLERRARDRSHTPSQADPWLWPYVDISTLQQSFL